MIGTLRTPGAMPSRSPRSLIHRSRRTSILGSPRALILILACALAPTVFAQGLRLARNLATEARAAANARVPLVIFFSQPDCDYCERARRDYLEPMVAQPGANAHFRLVEVDITSGAPLVGFDGRKLTQAFFARDQNVRIVPTLAFLGAQGESLAEPLVGLTVPDFYQSYIDRRIEQARARLAPRPAGS
jgi:thioredoxin-related protein